MFRKFFLLVWLCCTFTLSAQNYLDSLSDKLSKAENDSIKIELYSKLLQKKNISQTVKDSILKKLSSGFQKNCFNTTYISYKKALYYEGSNSSDKAVKLYLESLSEGENCKNYPAMARAKCRLGSINSKQKNFKLAVTYLHSSISDCNKCNDLYDLAEAFTILGTLYKNNGPVDSALYYHTKALDIRLKLGNKKLLSLTYNNIGLVYKKKKDYEKALKYVNMAYDIVIQLKDNRGTASLNNNRANILRFLKQPSLAITYALMARDTAYKFQSSDNYLNSLTTLAEAYESDNNYKESTETYKIHIKALDSIKAMDVNSDYQELQAKYESDKKDAELVKRENNLKLSESENSKKNLIIIFSCLALLLAAVAVVFIFRSYKQSKKNAKALKSKNKEIIEKNKEITDSINYAKNIQQSLLTSQKTFKENTRDHFVLFIPKDIVSGDFYWAQKINNDFIIVCADCTGHGVPGAFMSLLGISYIKEIVNGHKTIRPDLILNELREKVIESFEVNENKDGMDISLININGNMLQLAAANNPVWIIRNQKNTIVRPDKFPIGKHYGKQENFTLNNIKLEANDLIILFSDGYADQFGGEKGKKFKYKNLENIIIKNSDKPLAEIQDILKTELSKWKGDNEQVDDILIIGVKI